MALTPPHLVISPKNRIKKVKVLYDGTKTGLEFSIAELELMDGSTAIGIRHDRNEWNENTDELGYPTIRGWPTWFIMPDMKSVLPVLNKMFGKSKK